MSSLNDLYPFISILSIVCLLVRAIAKITIFCKWLGYWLIEIHLLILYDHHDTILLLSLNTSVVHIGDCKLARHKTRKEGVTE